MSITKVKVTIKGKTPLLMHQFPMEPEKGMEKKDAKTQAEYVAYRDEETKELFIPGINIQRALINGATYSKGKGRASLQKPVAACVFIFPERVSLGTKDFTVDSRPVVVPATKGRIIRHRPRLDQWQCSFEIEFDNTLLKENEVRTVLDDTLDKVGLLDFRPEKKGPFGRAMVTDWEVVND